jgi:5,10-methylenetetrahydromethanopterin reductase
MSRLGIAFQTDKPFAEYAELAQLVDRYDFETISVYEDLFYQPAWPALFQFAMHTRRGLIGPSVVNPYLNHPVRVAAHVAMLDELSKGRAYFGVGRGAFFGSIGVTQPRPIRAIREMVEMVQRLLSGDRTPYDGAVFQADPQAHLHFDIPGHPVPVLIGTWGRRTSKLAGKIADMLKVGGCVNPTSAPVYRGYLEEGAKEVGRDGRRTKLVFGAVTVVDRDRNAAEALARQRVAMYIAVVGRLDPTYTPPEDEIAQIESAMEKGDIETAAKAISEESLYRFSCFGSPEDIVRRLEELFDAGVDRFEFGVPHGLVERDAIQLLGERVLPAFRE